MILARFNSFLSFPVFLSCLSHCVSWCGEDCGVEGTVAHVAVLLSCKVLCVCVCVSVREEGMMGWVRKHDYMIRCINFYLFLCNYVSVGVVVTLWVEVLPCSSRILSSLLSLGYCVCGVSVYVPCGFSLDSSNLLKHASEFVSCNGLALSRVYCHLSPSVSQDPQQSWSG